MTLEQIKEKLAKDNGNQSWSQYKETWREVLTEGMVDAIADEYARLKWDEACESQKKIIEERFSSMMDENFDSSLAGFISNEAPKPEFKP